MVDEAKEMVVAAAGVAAAAGVDALTGGMATTAALAGKGVEIVGGMFIDLIDGDTRRVQEAIRREELVSLIDARVLETLKKNFEDLRAKGTEPTVSDVTGVYSQFHACWLKSDPQKRELVRNAFVNAFNPDLYDSGILTLLFSKVDSLCYGDLVLLRLIVEEEGRIPSSSDVSHKAQLYYSARKRTEAGLSAYRSVGSNPLQDLHLRQLIDASLVSPDAVRDMIPEREGSNTAATAHRYRPTAFGIKVVQLVQEIVVEEDLKEAT